MRFRPLRTDIRSRTGSSRPCPTRPRRCAPSSSRPPAPPTCCTRPRSRCPRRCSASCSCAWWRPASTRSTRRPGPAPASPPRSSPIPRCSATTSAESSCAHPTSRTPSRPAPPVFGMAPFPRSGGTLRRVRGRADALGRAQAVVALARRSGRRAARGADRVGSGRRDRARARGPAHADPRRQRRRGPLRGAVRAYFGAHVTVTARRATRRGCGNSARPWSSTTRPRASRRSWRTSTSSSTSSATRMPRPARARSACCDPAACTSSCRPGRGRGTPTRRPQPACAPRATRSFPTAAHSRRSPGSSTPGRCRSTSTGCSTCAMPPTRTRRLEKGHTRGKIVLRVSDD